MYSVTACGLFHNHFAVETQERFLCVLLLICMFLLIYMSLSNV